MLKTRFVVVAIATLAAVSCSTQVAPVQPAPVDGGQVQSAQALPFPVPEGAQFVARARNSSNIYRVSDACRPLQGLNPDRVVFFWSLEAAVRAGYRLSDEEGCR